MEHIAYLYIKWKVPNKHSPFSVIKRPFSSKLFTRGTCHINTNVIVTELKGHKIEKEKRFVNDNITISYEVIMFSSAV